MAQILLISSGELNVDLKTRPNMHARLVSTE